LKCIRLLQVEPVSCDYIETHLSFTMVAQAEENLQGRKGVMVWFNTFLGFTHLWKWHIDKLLKSK